MFRASHTVQGADVPRALHVLRASMRFRHRTRSRFGHLIWPRQPQASMCFRHRMLPSIRYGLGIGSGPGIRTVQSSDIQETSDVAWAWEWRKHPDHPGIPNGPGTGFLPRHCIWPRHPYGSGIRLASSIGRALSVDMAQASMCLRHLTRFGHRMWPALRMRRRYSYDSGIG